MSRELTERQRRVLQYLERWIERNGYAPSLREAGAALGIRTPKGVAEHLRALERKGYIRREPRRPRALRILRSSRTLPLLGRIAAGSPSLAEQVHEEDIPIPAGLFGPGPLFALRVRGDSMTGDHIRDGDIAVIRRQAVVSPADIAAVLVEGEASLKRVRLRRGCVVLVPSNPSHRPIEVRRGEVRILGKMVGLIRR